MKEVRFISVLVLLTSILVFIELNSNRTTLKKGDIAFISLSTNNKDSFSIIAFVDIPARTKVRFTDSEWNGSRFGFDESDILWETGNRVIKANSIVRFTNLNTMPSVSNGILFGSMKLSSKGEAIFAYLGQERMPTRFLAAVANDEQSYGTLINTDLLNGKTAITFPKGTISASFKGLDCLKTKDRYQIALNKMCNYTLQKSQSPQP